ncbi:NAD-dependent succinate-semialdehyde dehydrogenase [Brevibacillus fluminis]|uniref:NAD-dependent succinate-semialdehyde dehydrogenase n=1 Tax=Brevibacillus fluminis TaxID=511487 RepID=A0A3M8DY38_9BACL|nr:NAD-dependent succinate-semialdehyde dehydrogenase [Brevibacillus fluminis]RNB92439.1 NAD-dependent succinate-semialdehyde dehydrogenase [Brevibacillus fluminis]
MKQAELKKGMYVNGEWVYLDKAFPVINPATLETVGTVPDGTVAWAKQAVDAAHAAFETWSKTTAYERAALLEKWHQAIDARLEEIAMVMTLEQGKPLAEAKGEMQYANSFIKWYAEEAKRVYGETIPASSGSKRILVQKQPVGVVAAITPWNFPAAMITRKIAPALAAGCTAVIKPAEQTPLTALLLVECAQEAGIPAGVINIVTTTKPGEIVDVWMEDSRVRKVTFTGSTPVGKLLMRNAAATMKKVSLELGGLAPFIIAEDANIDAAVAGLIQSKFRNAGQTCICANRIFVHESIKETFLEAFTKATAALSVGNGLDGAVDVGPLIDEEAVNKVRHQIEDAVGKGATLHGEPALAGATGYFLNPVVLSDVTDDMICMREETFGPIAPVSTYSTDKEAVKRANETPFGLAAYVFTQSLTKAFWFSENLEYGIVGVNDGAPSTAQAPFGGMKESGLGREGSHYGIDEYLEVKYVSMQLL